MVQAMIRELRIRKSYLGGQRIESIYFGGGTPSLLTPDNIQGLIDEVGAQFNVADNAEITLEANPDDLDAAKVNALKQTPVNRFSIGIQSFFEEDLRWMNRAHSAAEAHEAISRVQQAGYDNITVDLIYGYPLLTDDRWRYNINEVLRAGVPHVSAYSMTVEPRTALASFVRKGVQAPMDEGQSARQFEQLMDMLGAEGFEHYEISNFAKPGRYARHNSNYWKGVPYLGVGPSAHSFDGESRQWNVPNNARYLKALQAGELPFQRETLTEKDKLNEHIMTTLRTMWGLDLTVVESRFGKEVGESIRSAIQPFLSKGHLSVAGQHVTLTRKGKLLADHIAAELFLD
jgi:putative oxygen-independent coproporphyrinogen III oxidase